MPIYIDKPTILQQIQEYGFRNFTLRSIDSLMDSGQLRFVVVAKRRMSTVGDVEEFLAQVGKGLAKSA